jgi:putative PEP-CTERM system TPR-repeat lipoprotein
MRPPLRPLTVTLVLVVLALGGCDAWVSVDKRIARAEEGLEDGDFGRAASEAKLALDKAPANARARLLLARASLSLGNADAAADEIERAIKDGAAPADVEPLRIRTLLALRRLDEADAAIAAATTLDAHLREVLSGQLWLQRGDGLRALAAFDAALASRAGSPEALLGRAEALAATSNRAQARQEIAALLDSHPGSGAAWMLKAELDADESRYADAAEAFAKASANAAALSTPERIEALAGRVQMLILAGRTDEALTVQDTLERMLSGSPITMMSRARLALVLGDADAAVDRMQKVVQAIPVHLPARELLIEALLGQGSVQQALAEAGRAAGDFPDSDRAILTLASVQARTGALDQAEATLRPLVDRGTPLPQALSLAARLRWRQGDWATGIGLIERGIAQRPGDVRLQLELAAGYIAAGHADRAIALLREIPDGAVDIQRDRLLVVATAASQDAHAAQEEIERAVSDNPADAGLLVLAAGFFASIHDLPEARRFMDLAVEAGPENPGTLLAAARQDLGAGEYDRAEQRARRVLQASPGNQVAFGLLADISAARGNEADVERWLQEARRADPHAVRPRLLLARSALRKGQEERVTQLLDEIDQAAPGEARVQVAVGEILAEAGRSDPAAERFQRAVREDPALPEPHLGLARQHLARGDHPAARDQLEQALRLAPGWFPAASALARLEASQGRRARALEIVADLQQRAQDAALPRVLKGDVLLAAGDPGGAARAFEDALKRGADGSIAARAAAARLDAGMAQPEQPLLAWLDQRPRDLDARRALAALLLRQARRDEAIEEYRKIVAAAPDDAVSTNNLAWLYWEGKDARALEMAREAYELARGRPEIADTYAWILAQSGDPRKSVEILSQVSDRARENGTIQYHFGFALNAVGRKHEARAVLGRALAANDAFPERSEAEALLGEIGSEITE